MLKIVRPPHHILTLYVMNQGWGYDVAKASRDRDMILSSAYIISGVDAATMTNGSTAELQKSKAGIKA